MNYRAHALEAGFAIPEDPPVFTKYVSSITGPITEVALPQGGHTDWQAELVVGKPTKTKVRPTPTVAEAGDGADP